MPEPAAPPVVDGNLFAAYLARLAMRPPVNVVYPSGAFMTPILFLMAITLNIFTGEEISRTMQAGPFKTEPECQAANLATGFQHPDGAGRIIVYNCVALAAAGTT